MGLFYTVLGEHFGFKRDLAMGTWLIEGCRDHRMEWKELEKSVTFAIPDSNVVTPPQLCSLCAIECASNRPTNASRKNNKAFIIDVLSSSKNGMVWQEIRTVETELLGRRTQQKRNHQWDNVPHGLLLSLTRTR